jgi:hypothetical protein
MPLLPYASSWCFPQAQRNSTFSFMYIVFMCCLSVFYGSQLGTQLILLSVATFYGVTGYKRTHRTFHNVVLIQHWYSHPVIRWIISLFKSLGLLRTCEKILLCPVQLWNARFGVFTAALLKMQLFWGVKLCRGVNSSQDPKDLIASIIILTMEVLDPLKRRAIPRSLQIRNFHWRYGRKVWIEAADQFEFILIVQSYSQNGDKLTF